MKIFVDTNTISLHMTPLARALMDEVGQGNVSYVYFTSGCDPCRNSGVDQDVSRVAVDSTVATPQEIERLRSDADVILENRRDFDIMIRSAKGGKRIFYCSERWFKPIRIDAVDSECAAGRGIAVAGFLKMVLPFAVRRAVKMLSLFRAENSFLYLPHGIQAARDMARMCGLLNGDLRCMIRAPDLGFEPVPGGRIWAKDGHDKRYCLNKMRMWGYFVSRTTCDTFEHKKSDREATRALWVGRMFGWKRVDAVIKAVSGLDNISLDLIGSGPEERSLRKLAGERKNIRFLGSLPVADVRRQMREHDVYILASNEFEGWGAVINEALEEGMRVIGTYEAGASATLLPESNLFHAGDWRRLREILLNPIPRVEIGAWSVANAAKVLLEMGGGQ